MKRHKSIPLSLQKFRLKRIKNISTLGFLSRLADWMDNNEVIRIWIRINQSITAFTLLVAAVGYLLAVHKYTEDHNKSDEDRIAKAWDVITHMSGRQSNGGQLAALETLNSNKISLNNIDLHNTYLAGVHLEKAKLQDANFSGAVLIGANFEGADLEGANFRNSILIGANLAGATLSEADFTDSKIVNARIDVGIVLAQSLFDADLTNSMFVFDDEEGGRWEAFSDTIAEAKDDQDMQKILESACADSKAPPKMNEWLGINVHYKRCKSALNYNQISLKYPIAKGVIPYGFVLNPFRSP